MTLQEAVQLAMAHSQVLRDLGGLVMQAPDSVATVHNPAIQETDPRFGVDAALSAFDASWTTSTFFEKNDRALNNQFFGGGTRILQQDLLAYSSEIFKQNATGGQWTARHNVDYDFNNAIAAPLGTGPYVPESIEVGVASLRSFSYSSIVISKAFAISTSVGSRPYSA